VPFLSPNSVKTLKGAYVLTPTTERSTTGYIISRIPKGKGHHFLTLALGHQYHIIHNNLLSTQTVYQVSNMG